MAGVLLAILVAALWYREMDHEATTRAVSEASERERAYFAEAERKRGTFTETESRSRFAKDVDDYFRRTIWQEAYDKLYPQYLGDLMKQSFFWLLLGLVAAAAIGYGVSRIGWVVDGFAAGNDTSE